MLDLLDEVDGRMTRAVIGWPAIKNYVWAQQKHVKHALNHHEQVDMHEVLEQTRGWMISSMVNYPDLDEHFRPIVNKINDELGHPRI